MSIQRRTTGRTARDYTIVIAYDGEKTEDEYFRSWKLIIPPARLTLVPVFVKSGGNPAKAVGAALQKKKKMRDFAEFWCVCDVDGASPQSIQQAKDHALKGNIKLCLSNRCFEVWFALHWKRFEKKICSETEAVALVQTTVPTYSASNKSVPFAELLPLTDDAIQNAKWLRERGHENPSTNVDGLVKKLKSNLS